MTTESNRRIMERFTSEFLTTDDPAEAARLAEQWIHPRHHAAFRRNRAARSPNISGCRRVQPRDLPGPRLDLDQTVADRDSVAVRYTLRATQLAFYRLADGKIFEERAQLDMLSVLQQIGAIPCTA